MLDLKKNISEFSKLIDIYGEFEFCNNQIKISSKAVDARGQMVLGFTLEVIEHSIIIPECKATESLKVGQKLKLRFYQDYQFGIYTMQNVKLISKKN